MICKTPTVVFMTMDQPVQISLDTHGAAGWLLPPVYADATLLATVTRAGISKMIEMNISPPKIDTSALITAVARKDRAAFSQLFDHYAPRLKSMLAKGGLDAVLAEECAQDVLLTVWRKADQFDPAGGSASGWIYAIARNLRIDVVRKNQRGLRLIEAVEHDSPQAGASAFDAVAATQMTERVNSALTALNSEQLQVLRLSFFESRPHPEIAAILNIPLGTVKSRIRLAMQRLRSILDEFA